MTQSPNSQSALPKLSIHFVRFGHYHLARLRSAAQQMGCNGWLVQGMQVCTSDAVYAWDQIDLDADRKENDRLNAALVTTVFPGAHYEDLSRGVMCRGIGEHLDREQPDAIAVAGWGSLDARACLHWARQNRRRAILMSETRRADGHRAWWKESLKSRYVKKFDAAIVGAKSHEDYLVDLGMRSDQIFRGYNVIDDRYFVSATREVQIKSDRVKQVPFFLASNRFVPIKNLVPAVDAFTAYRSHGGTWNLCLLGDGPQRADIIARAQSLGLRIKDCPPWDDDFRDAIVVSETKLATVYLPGFRQIDELPNFYAHASAFLHPAISEPWGLVINEAMASGLPIVASRNGGAAEELIDEDVNGVTFDPTNGQAMAEAMRRVAALPDETLAIWGEQSRRILAERIPTTAFGDGLKRAVAMLFTASDPRNVN